MTSGPFEASSQHGPDSDRPNINSRRRIELALTLTPADVFQASMALTWRSLVRIVGVFVLLAILLVVLDSRGLSNASLDGMVSVVVVVAVLVGPACVWLVYIRSRKAFRSSRVYGSALKYLLTEKGLEVRGPTFTATSDWSNVALARETRLAFILWSTDERNDHHPQTLLP